MVSASLRMAKNGALTLASGPRRTIHRAKAATGHTEGSPASRSMKRFSGWGLHLETTMLMATIALGWRAATTATQRDCMDRNCWVIKPSRDSMVALSNVTHGHRRAESRYSLRRRAPKKARADTARQRARRSRDKSTPWRTANTEVSDVRRSSSEARAQKMVHRDRYHGSGRCGQDDGLVALHDEVDKAREGWRRRNPRERSAGSETKEDLVCSFVGEPAIGQETDVFDHERFIP